MIERIASHVGDFTPRLQSNTRALYQYCPIPVVVFPQLENELFCNIYYLRHLCDTTRFPDWPIKDPVRPPAVFLIILQYSRDSSSCLKGIGKEFQQLVIRQYLDKSIQKKLFCHLQSLQIKTIFQEICEIYSVTVVAYVIYIYGGRGVIGDNCNIVCKYCLFIS